MKVKRAIKAALQWSRGDESKAAEIFRQQAALDPELNKQFKSEAEAAYIDKLVEEFLANGYSLDRPAELIAAVGARLRNGPADNEAP